MDAMDGYPFSQAAENNREPILRELTGLLADARTVLEIGAGTGQHAVAFARAFPDARWQPTEHPQVLTQLRPRCEAAALPNLLRPWPLDIRDQPWDLPAEILDGAAWPDAVYTANTVHIVSKTTVEALFDACAAQGKRGSRLVVYGPFNYRGRFTSESNARFDDWLKDRDPASGIRDFEWVDSLARQAGFGLLEDIAMPANNRLLAWERRQALPV